MRHLSVEELLDFAESAAVVASHPHLASCEECRRQLADARSAMASLAGVEVPEPSPLFWDHLSARIHEAVVAEEPPRRSWLGAWAVPHGRLLAAVSAAAAIIVVVGIALLRPDPAPEEVAATVPAADAAPVFTADVQADDPTFGLVSELTADIDIDTALEAGLASGGSAEQAVVHMSSDELLELQRLLQEEMGRTQAS
jgi:hypothetical protein